MSQCIGVSVLRADDFPEAKIETDDASHYISGLNWPWPIQRIPLSDSDIVSLPDPRAARVMTRTALILYRVAHSLKPLLSAIISDAPSRVGLYCANNRGPVDFSSTLDVARADDSQMTSILLKKLPPKQAIKCGSNIPGAQCAIFLGIEGRFLTFTHSQYGALHALDQAENDLVEGVIDRALVCSAFGLENPLENLRTERVLTKEVVLCEGGVAAVLVPNGDRVDWNKAYRESSVTQLKASQNYGIADPLMRLANTHLSSQMREGQN